MSATVEVGGFGHGRCHAIVVRRDGSKGELVAERVGG